jgi:hypothetical protein
MMAALTDDSDRLDTDAADVPGYCNACFTGTYPFASIPVDVGRKEVFDGVLADADLDAGQRPPVGLRQ